VCCRSCVLVMSMPFACAQTSLRSGLKKVFRENIMDDGVVTVLGARTGLSLARLLMDDLGVNMGRHSTQASQYLKKQLLNNISTVKAGFRSLANEVFASFLVCPPARDLYLNTLLSASRWCPLPSRT
jgi:hypothetical protein